MKPARVLEYLSCYMGFRSSFWARRPHKFLSEPVICSNRVLRKDKRSRTRNYAQKCDVLEEHYSGAQCMSQKYFRGMECSSPDLARMSVSIDATGLYTHSHVCSQCVRHVCMLCRSTIDRKSGFSSKNRDASGFAF